MMTITEIRQALRDRNLAYVAERVGTTRQHLWAIVNGRSLPSVALLERISEYLNRGGEHDDNA